MNKTEKQAYTWLSHQYKTVTHHLNRTPDFTTDTGDSYEAKHCYSNIIMLTPRQMRFMQPGTKILAFRNHDEEPVCIIPFENIKDGAVFNNVQVYIRKDDTDIVRISKSHLEEIKLLKLAWNCHTVDEVVEEMLKRCRLEKIKALVREVPSG